MDDHWQLKGRANFQCSSWPAHLNQTDNEPGRLSSPNPYISQQRPVSERNVCQEATLPNLWNSNSQNLLSTAGKPHAHQPVTAVIPESPQCFQPDYNRTASSLTSYVTTNQTCLTTGPANISDAGGWPSLAFGTLPFIGKVGSIASISGIPDLSQGASGGNVNQLSRRSNGVEFHKATVSMNRVMADLCVQPQYQVSLWQTSNRSLHLQSTISEKYLTFSSHGNILPPVMDNSFAKPLSRPRVFCTSVSGSFIGGELTMSENGTLGVICFCHNLHMSVAKFSEHAGLFAVNPGSSILVEGGETLSQWRKTFFSQFRVKVPEDHMGWDWEESRGSDNNGLVLRSSQKDVEAVYQGDCVVSKDRGDLYTSVSVSMSTTIGSRSNIGGMGITQNQLAMHMAEKASLESQKIVLESCNGSSCGNTALDMDLSKRDLLTSKFELRLGQPSEENASLGSRHLDSLQSRVCTGLVSQAKQSTYELASHAAWEQHYHQSVEQSTLQRPATCGGYMDQSDKGTPTPNWLSDKQRNRDGGMLQVNLESHKQLDGLHHMQARMFPDIHPMQYLSSPQIQTRNVDVVSNVMPRPSGDMNGSEHRRAEPISLQESPVTPFNSLHNDLARATDSNPQSSVLPIRPTVVNADSIRNGEAMFSIHYEKPRPVMGPPERMCPSSEARIIRTSVATDIGGSESCRTAWVRRVSYVDTPDRLSSYSHMKALDETSSAINRPKLNEVGTQQRFLVQTRSEHVVDEVDVCHVTPSALDTCKINEGCKSFENNQQSGNSEKFIEVIPNEPSFFQTESMAQELLNGRNMTVEGKSPSGVHENDYKSKGYDRADSHGKAPTRGVIEDPKRNEALPYNTLDKFSSIDDSSLDEAVTRNGANAHERSVYYDATIEEIPIDKCLLDGSSATPNKGEEYGSSRTLHDSTVKRLFQNEVVLEKSGIGKSCSSVEADMEAITSVGPVSSQSNAQVLESQASIAHSSSSNAVISDTLSNTGKARKLFLEVDKCATAKADEAGSWMRRSCKRGRRASKWRRSLEDSCSLEGEIEENLSRCAAIAKQASASDAICSAPSAGSLKRKRSGLCSVSDLSRPRISTIPTESTSREVNEGEPIVRCQVSKPVGKQLENAVGKQGRETSISKRETSRGKVKWVKYQDLISPTRSIKASSSLKKSPESVQHKSRTLPLSDLHRTKAGKFTVERHYLKGVKMASLSSILNVPRANLAFKTKVGQRRGLPPVGEPVAAHSKAILLEHALRMKKNQKRSVWEMEAKSVPYAIDVPVGITSSKFTMADFGYTCQNTASELGTMDHVGKTSAVSGLKTTMVVVPLKFVPQTRLETEDLHRETRALVNSAVDDDHLSSRLVKRSQSQGAYARRVTCASVESIGFLSENEANEEKSIRGKKISKRRSNSNDVNYERSMECCVCGESCVQRNNVLMTCARCGLGVHQACYGVADLSRKRWICRPCKVHATNIVCILCGYGQGAMTRAKKSGALAKGLVQAWQAEDAKHEGIRQDPIYTEIDQPDSNHNPQFGHCDIKALQDMGGHLVANSKVVSNSVVCGLTDPKVTQWVHIVCALWMPGTRCINLETMAAFDVSGVASSARKWVCSICKRAGGACIKCRVEKCATRFHPWCAHGKGLLQNEACGEEEDKVGFFGRCEFHGKLAIGECSKEEAAVDEPMVADNPENCSGTCAHMEGG